MGKNIERLVEIYTKLNAYKQGAAGRLLYLSYPWIPCFEMTINHKRVVPHLDYLLCYLRGDLFMGWWSKTGMEKIARLYFNKNLQDTSFIFNLRRNWQKGDLARTLALVKTIEKIDLAKLSQAGLLKLFYKFGRVCVSTWREVIFLDMFDLMGEPLLEETLKNHQLKLTAENLQILTSVTELSTLQTEKKQLLALTAVVRKIKDLEKAVINKDSQWLAQNFPKFFRALQNHAQNYHWLYNDYAIIRRLDENFFLKIIKDWLQQPKEFKKEEEILKAAGKLKVKRQQLIKQQALPSDVLRTINLLVVLSEWRDQRKAFCQATNGAIRLLAGEFGRRNHIPLVKIENLFWWELPKLFTQEKNKLIKISQQRYAGSFFEGRLDTDSIHFGLSAEKLRAAADHAIQAKAGLVGRTAFAGQAVGRVKIILTQDSFKKMKPGAILVAHNTRPEYVRIMKMAAAIVTEEGGITSHAAIVARELKIPCVVGVQGVMSILKDGDRVEVDATRGIVRKL